MKNTIDVTVDIYTSPTDYTFRIQVKTHPDIEDMITLSEQYLEDKKEKYSVVGAISFDKENWEKIKHAVDTVFSNSK